MCIISLAILRIFTSKKTLRCLEEASKLYVPQEEEKMVQFRTSSEKEKALYDVGASRKINLEFN